jgi:hypothetical protein
MAQQGGKRPVRTKTKPMPVSGPGALSQRTDMMTASDPNVYGDRKATEELMAGAPMAKVQDMPIPSPVVGLFEPTTRPDEPVTAGNPMGPGPGPEVLNSNMRTFNPTQILTRLAQNDPSGEVEMILRELSSKGIV